MVKRKLREGERARVETLFQFDRQEACGGLLVGIDEAGRGPWAGPVIAAAVAFPSEVDLDLLRHLNDSKKLSPARREQIASHIENCALAFGVGAASPAEIDRMDIEKATFLAMKRALIDSGLLPNRVLVDGHRDPGLGVPTRCVVKGDSQSAAIAAASILAKTTRDRLMENLGGEEDPYGFRSHKGYGAAYHQHALAVYGVSEHHRKTYKPVARCLDRPGPSEEFLTTLRIIRAAESTEQLEAAVASVNRLMSLLAVSEVWLLRQEIEASTKRLAKLPAPDNLRKRGTEHEEFVCRFLEQRGYKILERNYHGGRGEIDLIAREGETLVFIEVKMRRGTSFGEGADAVDFRKRSRMGSAALEYLSLLDHETDCRFDVVSLQLHPDGLLSVDHFPGAFSPGEEAWS